MKLVSKINYITKNIPSNVLYNKNLYYTQQLPRINHGHNKRYIIQQNNHVKSSVILEIKDNTESIQDIKKDYEGKTAVIVGAGPSGATAAAYLAKNGFNVKIYEKLDDPRYTDFQSIGYTALILLTPKTIEVLKDININIPEEKDGFKNGLHIFNGMVRVTSKNEIVQGEVRKDGSIIGERYDIAKTIILNINEKYKDKVEFNFTCMCGSVDFDKQIARFKNEKNEIIEETYDLLIGSDGINSHVRTELQKYNKDFTLERKPSERLYCTIRDLGPIHEDDEISKLLNPGYLLIMDLKTKRFEGKYLDIKMSILLDDRDKLIVTMSGLRYQMEYIRGKEEKWFHHSISELFPKHCKNDFIKKLSEAELLMPGSINRASTFIGPKTMLIGDAAHAVTPTLGLGCNMAIQDAKYINMALNKENEIDSVILSYNELRYDEIQCIQDLQESIVISKIHKTFKEQLWVFYGLIHLILHSIGYKLLPKYIRPTVYYDVTRNRLSAIDAVKLIKAEGNIIMFLILIFIFKIFKKIFTKT